MKNIKSFVLGYASALDLSSSMFYSYAKKKKMHNGIYTKSFLRDKQSMKSDLDKISMDIKSSMLSEKSDY